MLTKAPQPASWMLRLSPVLAACPVWQECSGIVGVGAGLRPPDHIRDLQVFDEDQVVVGDQFSGFVVVQVAALVGDLAMPGGDSLGSGTAIVRAPLFAGQALLCRSEPAGRGDAPSGDCRCGARRR